MLTCFDVADYFLSRCDDESGDTISNLKLQKLVYYAQGFSLVLLGRPLFAEKIEAWMHGPVIPELYRKYKDYKNCALPQPESINWDNYAEDEIELLDDVWNVYGQFSAWKLRNMTHEESPWKNNYIEGVGSQEIDEKDLIEFFETRIN
ncbi:Panacea domain-containing protein [Providencia stuartii]|uniref:Panacea domain-containing protein n=1 Tax=Providencia stuartii TaxID=588 RepID=UPI003826A564